MLFTLTDSEISRIEQHGNTLRIRFAAALVQPSAQDATTDAPPRCTLGTVSAGYVRNLVLSFSNAHATGDAAACFGRISEAGLRHGGQRLRHIPVSAQWDDGVQLQLQCSHGVWLQVDASALQCQIEGDAQLVEAFQC